jgi:hypothetical protein
MTAVAKIFEKLPVPLVLCALGSAGALYSGWLAGGLGAGSWAGAFEWGFTGGILAAAVLGSWAIVTRRLGLRVWLGAGLMAAMFSLVVLEAVGVQLFEVRPWHDARYSIFLASLLGLTTVGLVRRWFLGRWLAMALAVGGMVGAAMNLAPWLTLQSGFTWMMAIHIAGALVGLGLIGGKVMREHFEKDAAELWKSSDPIIRSLRWTLLTHFVAIPMLLVYAWLQPIVPATQTLSLLLAAGLSAAVALTLARRVLGALLLVAGGVVLLAHTGLTLAGAQEVQWGPRIALYYAVFWIPAALAALVCGARMAVPFLHMLRRS